MEIRFREDLGVSPEEFRSLKGMLSSLFPDTPDITQEFLCRLTPGALKDAYITQASACRSNTLAGLSEKEQKSIQAHYENLSLAYKILLPRVDTIHKNVKRLIARSSGVPLTDEASNKVIIAVGGAKGGVGKSLLSANIAVGLGLLGQRVVIADLDFGGADLHLYLGVRSLSRDWNDFMGGRAKTLDEIISSTPFDGVRLIGGDSSKLGSPNIRYSQKLKIIRQLKALECDYVILDLGGDSSVNVLDFFLLADQKIVVTGVEPASILDTYNFVKVAFLRLLERYITAYKSIRHISSRIHERNRDEKGGFELDSILKEIGSIDPAYAIQLKQKIEQFSVSIVVNMAEKRKDRHIAGSMQDLLKRKCSIELGSLGCIPFDKSVRKASRSLTPFLIENPRCGASKMMYRMLAGILLLRKPRSIRADLIRRMREIRGETMDRIGKEPVRLEALTQGQIQLMAEGSHSLSKNYRRILKFMAS